MYFKTTQGQSDVTTFSARAVSLLTPSPLPLSTSLRINWLILNKEIPIKYLRFHPLPPSYEQAGSLKHQHPEKGPSLIGCVTIPTLVRVTPTCRLFSPIRVLWRIGLPCQWKYMSSLCDIP